MKARYLRVSCFFYGFYVRGSTEICKKGGILGNFCENGLSENHSLRQDNHSRKRENHSRVSKIQKFLPAIYDFHQNFPKTHLNFPIIHPIFPIIHPIFPIIHINFPIIHINFPIIHINFLIIHINFPIIHTNFPIIHTNFPIIHTNLHIFNQKTQNPLPQTFRTNTKSAKQKITSALHKFTQQNIFKNLISGLLDFAFHFALFSLLNPRRLHTIIAKVIG